MKSIPVPGWIRASSIDDGIILSIENNLAKCVHTQYYKTLNYEVGLDPANSQLISRHVCALRIETVSEVCLLMTSVVDHVKSTLNLYSSSSLIPAIILWNRGLIAFVRSREA